MNPRAALVAAVLAALAPAPASADPPVETILRRAPSEEAPPRLGPTRLQGDFAANLDRVLAAAVADSATTTTSPVPEPSPAARPRPVERQPHVVLPVLGGLVGGAAGLYGGAIAGALIADREGGGDLDALGGAIAGGILGEAFVLPLGVHLGNARRGSFGASLGVSLLTAAAGWLLIAGTGSPAIAGAAAVVHLGLVVAAERAAGRRGIADRAP